jgi:hypothetical protein
VAAAHIITHLDQVAPVTSEDQHQAVIHKAAILHIITKDTQHQVLVVQAVISTDTEVQMEDQE